MAVTLRGRRRRGRVQCRDLPPPAGGASGAQQSMVFDGDGTMMVRAMGRDGARHGTWCCGPGKVGHSGAGAGNALRLQCGLSWAQRCGSVLAAAAVVAGGAGAAEWVVSAQDAAVAGGKRHGRTRLGSGCQGLLLLDAAAYSRGRVRVGGTLVHGHGFGTTQQSR